MKTFDPTKFNFVLLEDFRIPDDVSVYEFKNHSTVDGKRDFLRLNLYLTVDNKYVTIWFGLRKRAMVSPVPTRPQITNSRVPMSYPFEGG